VNGGHEQKQRFLPDICSGSKIGGMCMSEPNAGTDVLGMKTNASFDSEKNGWIINGYVVISLGAFFVAPFLVGCNDLPNL